MSTPSLDKFLASLERSGLASPDQLAALLGDWQSGNSTASERNAYGCADYLVDSGLLTRWQAKKLLDGRHRGFFLGKYRLLDHLGSGGMSSVYLARHVLMQRLVAIKVLPQDRVSDGSYLARFHLEGQCTAALDHPNIVRAYDLDSADKIHYLVMEYIDGHDLEALVSHDGPLGFHVAADYVAQAAAGLQHAHEAGLVHRDIKPANLLVDLQGTVKIFDMGLAKFAASTASSALARDEQVVGTADFVAPEQAINSSAVDVRADIYSLGCTLYFLLAGHPPFVEGSPLERMQAHLRQAPPSILVDRPDAPQPLLEICRRMMEKLPDNRHQSASEVHDALAEWLAGEAAAGRFVERADGARHSRLTRHSRDAMAGSKIDLISGSNADLDRVVPPVPPLAPPLSPLAPPVVAPPLPLPATLLVTAPVLVTAPPIPLVATPVVALAVAIPLEDPIQAPIERAGAARLWHRSKSAKGVPWMSVLVLTGMIFATVLLALLAWPK